MVDKIVHYIAFNDAQDCFACATNTGVFVFNCDPLIEKSHVSAEIIGSVKICRMLHRTNILAIVGGGKKPKFADNAVLIWDNKLRGFVLEITFASPVVDIRITHSRLIVLLERQVNVFSFPNPCVKQCCIQTRPNPSGLCSLSCDVNNSLFVYPANKSGSVHILDLNLVTVGGSASQTTIQGHQSDLTCLTLNKQGTLLATGSNTGTVIRLFETRNRTLISEFRRGTDPSTLYGIQFSGDSSFLCVSSDKGTAHVFAVKDRSSNKKSLLQHVGIVTEGSDRSLAQFSFSSDKTTICGFVNQTTVICISKDGKYHRFVFSEDKAKCHREAFDNFLEIGDDSEFWNVEK